MARLLAGVDSKRKVISNEETAVASSGYGVCLITAGQYMPYIRQSIAVLCFPKLMYDARNGRPIVRLLPSHAQKANVLSCTSLRIIW